MERILILGLTPLTEQILREIRRRSNGRLVVAVCDDAPSSTHHVVGCRSVGPFCCLETAVDKLRPHRVVVALTERRGRAPMRALLELCVVRDVIVEDAADFFESLSGQIALEALTPSSIIFSRNFRRSRVHDVFARCLSVVTAIVALVVLSPLLGLIASAIKLDSHGPVLFVHERAGARGQPFNLLKFRTMHAERARRSEWEADNRDHVTRVGKWLRAFRLDELPQFINILRGEMNLVGPRPHPVSNLELFTLVGRNLNERTGTAVAYYALRLLVRPGLTGWAQVCYRYANNLEEEMEKLRYDLYYVKHRSPWLDLRILLETVIVLSRGRGAADPAAHSDADVHSAAGLLAISRKVDHTKTA